MVFDQYTGTISLETKETKIENKSYNISGNLINITAPPQPFTVDLTISEKRPMRLTAYSNTVTVQIIKNGEPSANIQYKYADSPIWTNYNYA